MKPLLILILLLLSCFGQKQVEPVEIQIEPVVIGYTWYEWEMEMYRLKLNNYNYESRRNN